MTHESRAALIRLSLSLFLSSSSLFCCLSPHGSTWLTSCAGMGEVLGSWAVQHSSGEVCLGAARRAMLASSRHGVLLCLAQCGSVRLVRRSLTMSEGPCEPASCTPDPKNRRFKAMVHTRGKESVGTRGSTSQAGSSLAFVGVLFANLTV